MSVVPSAAPLRVQQGEPGRWRARTTLGTDPIQEIKCDTAREFIEALRPTHPRFDVDGSSWRYRGHGDARFELLPSLFRDGVDGRYALPKELEARVEEQAKYISEAPRRPEHRERCPRIPTRLFMLEHHLTSEFDRIADRIGLAPSLKQPGRPGLVWYTNPSSPLEPTALHALARHHGIESQLLDFSHLSLVAAHFAAADAAELIQRHSGGSDCDKRLPECLEVWCVDIGRIESMQWEAVNRSRTTPGLGVFPGLAELKVEYRSNDFLRQQRGAFLHDQSIGYRYMDKGDS